MSTIIHLEPGDTPGSVWNELDTLSKIQFKNRVDKLSTDAHEGAALILERNSYGLKIMARVLGDFEHDERAKEWGNEFIDVIRSHAEKERTPKLFEGYYTHENLVRRAMMNAGHNLQKAPRWVHVKSIFGTGSYMAGELCRAFRLDPEEMIGTEEEAE